MTTTDTTSEVRNLVAAIHGAWVTAEFGPASGKRAARREEGHLTDLLVKKVGPGTAYRLVREFCEAQATDSRFAR